MYIYFPRKLWLVCKIDFCSIYTSLQILKIYNIEIRTIPTYQFLRAYSYQSPGRREKDYTPVICVNWALILTPYFLYGSSSHSCLSRELGNIHAHLSFAILTFNLRKGNKMSDFQPEEKQCVKIAPPSSLMPHNNFKSPCRESLLVVLRFEKMKISFFAPHQAEHALLALAANWPPTHFEI